MLKSFSAWLNHVAKTWHIVVLLSLGLFLVLFVFDNAEKQIQAHSGGTGTLDRKFFPATDVVLQSIGDYGKAGRVYYRTLELTADIIFPFDYALLLGLSISLLRSTLDPESRAQLLNLLPFAAGFFDLLENLGIIVLLSAYPTQPLWIAGLVTICNGLKWSLIGLSALILVFALGAHAFRKIKRS